MPVEFWRREIFAIDGLCVIYQTTRTFAKTTGIA